MVLTQVFHNGSEEDGKAFFKDLYALEPLVDTTAVIPYEQLNSLLNHAAGFGGRKQFGGGVSSEGEYKSDDDLLTLVGVQAADGTCVGSGAL